MVDKQKESEWYFFFLFDNSKLRFFEIILEMDEGFRGAKNDVKGGFWHLP